jgi:Fe-S-cluster containining protein
VARKMLPSAQPECMSCGLCCLAPTRQDQFCDLSESDIDALPAGWVKKNVDFSSVFDFVLGAIDGRTMPIAAIKTKLLKIKAGPLKGNVVQPCIALKGDPMYKVKCSIYERRPATCRTSVVPGDRTCLELRRVYGEHIGGVSCA